MASSTQSNKKEGDAERVAAADKQKELGNAALKEGKYVNPTKHPKQTNKQTNGQ